MIEITIPDFSNPFEVTWWLFTHGGWILIVITIGYGIWWLYMDYIQGRFVMNTKYVLLAVDVPKENEQTPKAVEHIFSHLHGIHKNPNFFEKYRDGYVQPTITIELVSIGGYIQFLLRVPEAQRDLAEAAIYAQYPNAEISEVEDYVNQFEAKFPNDEYDMWGAEMVLIGKDYLPIRTYPQWEHSLTQTFLDPMASMLEMMGRLQSSEQMWFQLVLRPNADNGWRQKGLEAINKLAGIKSKKKNNGVLTSLSEAPGNLALGTWETITRTLFDPGEYANKKKEDNAPPSLMQHLTPNVKAVIEAIAMKISKLGFDVKFRTLYFGGVDVFSKSRVSAITGALKQFNTLDLNGFKPDSKMKTSRDFFFVKRRVANLKRRLLWGYKYRSIWRGRKIFVLNTEELASLWHFPVLTVKAPQVKKQEAKRGEPPVALPVGEEVEYIPKARPTASDQDTPASEPTPIVVSETTHVGTPPPNLPIG
jgi:hypothetical protein